VFTGGYTVFRGGYRVLRGGYRAFRAVINHHRIELCPNTTKWQLYSTLEVVIEWLYGV